MKCDSIYIERCIQDMLACKFKKEYLTSTPKKKTKTRIKCLKSKFFFFQFHFLSLCCLLHFLLGNASKTDSFYIIMEMVFQSAEGSTLLSARACKPAFASVLQASQVENRHRQTPIRHKSGYYVWIMLFILSSEM